MDALDAGHPTDQTLRAYGVGELFGALAESVDSHLSECGECRQRVAEMSDDTFLGRLRDAQARPESPAPVGPPYGGMSITEARQSSIGPPPASSIPPDLAELPDYEILGELGRGGMGVVYLAQNKLMGRKEVLKVVGRELVNRRGVLDRFLREIRNAAQLHHPNIVTAYSAIRAGESFVFAMEYVEGYDLAQLVEAQGPLPVAHACNFIYQAALGLQYAHQKGMVHRDIKPSNLILAREGKKPVVKVLDFGLAKATREGPADGALTHEGQMLGTPHYIAPEQSLDAQKADIRADIYSLGCTLYCLLSGGPPFQGSSLYEVLQAHHSMEAKPLNLVRPEVPWELASVVGKMMAKDRERRYQNPREVVQALRPFFNPAAPGAIGLSGDVSPASQRAVEIGARAPESVPYQPQTSPPPAMHRRDVTKLKSKSDPTVAESPPSNVQARAADATTSEAPSRFGAPLPRGREPVPETLLQVAPLRRRNFAWFWVCVTVLPLLAVLGISIYISTDTGTVTIIPKPTPTADGGRRKAASPSSSAPAEPKPAPAATAARPPQPVPLPQKTQPPPTQPSREWTNSIGMKFVRIEPGEFRMGSRRDQIDQLIRRFPTTKSNDWWNGEQPQHSVEITWRFLLGVHEVTQGQYQTVMGGNPSKFKGSEYLPVEQVSWWDAVNFCNKLSERESRRPYYRINLDKVTIYDGNGYRLPTEAEWEYACRAGTPTLYPFGDDGSALGEYAWLISNSHFQTHAVGRKRANPWGLHDMMGNVWEWCADWYDVKYYGSSPAIDPPGAPRALNRVARGGAWECFAGFCRPAFRGGFAPGRRENFLGFRVVAVQE